MKNPAFKFTLRQKQLACLMILGAPRKKMASTLQISVSTVDDHLEKIRHKIGAATTAEAISILFRIKGPGYSSASFSGLLKKRA